MQARVPRLVISQPDVCLAIIQAEAKAHFDKRLSTFPEGMPVVTLSALPARPDRWLLARCVRGQTPQMIQVEVCLSRCLMQALSDADTSSVFKQL